MGEPVLSTAAVLPCAHGGQARVASVSPRVRVGGTPVLLAGAPAPVAGCANPPPPGPCVTAQFSTAAVRVRVQGRPVLLRSSLAVCAPTGTALLPPVPGQVRVRGV